MTGVLDRLSAETWATLLQYFERVEVDEGDVLVAEGQVGMSLFIILEGELEVFSPAPERRRLSTMRPGQLFGEIAFFDGLPRSATVRAGRRGVVMRLGERSFNALREREPDVACDLLLELGRALAARFRRLESGSG